MSREENLQTIERMWAALSAQDWETLKGCLDPEVEYEVVWHGCGDPCNKDGPGCSVS